MKSIGDPMMENVMWAKEKGMWFALCVRGMAT